MSDQSDDQSPQGADDTTPPESALTGPVLTGGPVDLGTGGPVSVDLTPPGDQDDAAPASDQAPLGHDAPSGLVKARWVSPQASFNPEQGVIAYGDPVMVSAEQLEDPATPAIAWSKDWAPDASLAALHEAAAHEAELRLTADTDRAAAAELAALTDQEG